MSVSVNPCRWLFRYNKLCHVANKEIVLRIACVPRMHGPMRRKMVSDYHVAGPNVVVKPLYALRVPLIDPRFKAFDRAVVGKPVLVTCYWRREPECAAEKALVVRTNVGGIHFKNVDVVWNAGRTERVFYF